ncbi:UvrD-helicase domain-containing protein [Ignavibacterium sp.]|uniref:UvrD-helicase domain-containing protein n=1 Tax=Ignavibacterium sp. TaxID=2651167 RepID=UPI0021FC1397|nr:UvrD-helicase domain-containing protein [Ignavibacterium sp.]BDQ01542.1 MAG: hypothetical protein KatS3mg037_0117 [Ignavibacterium sp.]
MKFISAFTDECLKDAKKYNLENELNYLVEKIEKNQTSRFLEKYKSPAVVKRAGGYRFIGYEILLEDTIFIVFLRILLKGKKEYEEFCYDSDSYCKNILPTNDWINSICDKKKNSNLKEKPTLSELEKSYLFTPIPDDFSGSMMIYESKKFVQEIHISDYKLFFAEIIRDILEDEDSLNISSKKHKQNPDLIIYFKLLKQFNILFLYQAINKRNNEKFNQSDFERIVNSIISEESIMKECFRTYPEYVLYDDNIWLEIQNESEGNLALSTEEASILNSILHNKENEPLFPLFINGRAGSGKSTLLYYIFAHILLNHILIEKRLTTPPLFLTYSFKLLDTAKNTIKKILMTNSKIRLRLQNDINKSRMVKEYLDSKEYDKSFKTFRDFQLQLLNSNKLIYFTKDKHYGFAKFKEDWSNYCKRNPVSSVRRITSEFAWYVIRTFIKGMRTSVDDFLEPDEYVNLPRDLKSIDKETYKIIYEDVFLKWYKDHLKDNEYWDDQDLTRFVLDNLDDLNLDYPAVFCDEAQDFSNIELELISSLPIYARRIINYSDVKRIPLAFAGDPLQTINPTGFKWNTVKANFYEKINNEFNKSKKISMNYKELNNNYRSSRAIVVFNNIIQLVRAILFNIKDVAPQKAWFSTGSSLAPTLIINDFSVLDEALNDANKTRTIIIPCEEDQEKDFILNRDSFLKEKAIIGNDIVQNIWSPMNVKGLEYNTVIVYNFGDYLATSIGININDLLSDFNPEYSLEENKRIQLEYFFNKLYVATSRAKKNLVIVDSEIGNKFLWSLFNINIKNLTSIYSLFINEDIVWEEENEITEFQFTSEVLELAVDKPEDLAKQYYLDGINTSNPRKLRSASEYYKAAQKVTESNRSLAKAYELEHNYPKAAEYYEKIQEGDKATRCLWLSNDKSKYSKILEVYEIVPDNPNNIFKLASNFMINEDKKNNSILFLRNLSKLIQNSDNLEFYLLNDKSWDDFYKELMKALVDYSQENPNLSDWDEVLVIIRKLLEYGILTKNRKEYINLLYNLKQYKDVIEELNGQNDTENEFYLKANAEYLKFPANIEYLFKLGRFEQIVKLFFENAEVHSELNSHVLEFIIKSILNTSQPDPLVKIINKFGKNLNTSFSDQLLERTFLFCFEKEIYSAGFNIIEILDDRKDDEFYINLLKNNLDKNDKNLINYFLALFVYQEFLYNRYHTVIDILENQRVELNFLSKDLINVFLLQKLIIFELALKKDKISKKLEPKMRLQEYIKKLLVNSDIWRNMCSVQIAGAAIERLEYHKNSRDYYKKIIYGNFSEEEQEFAKLRWLKVTFKQAKNEKSNEKKQKLEIDIQNMKKKWNLDETNIDDLPEFPEVSDEFQFSFDEPTELDKTVKTKINIDLKVSISINGEDKFSIKKITEKSILKNDNLILDEIIYFDLQSKQFDSKEASINLIKSNDDIEEYEISDWGLIIQLSKNSESDYLSFYHKNISSKILDIAI